MGFYVSQKDQVLNPSFLFPGFSRSTDRSTEVEVGRPGRSTDVHRRARLCALEGRSTARELLLSGKPRSTERSTDIEYVLCSRGSVDRAGRPLPQRSEK